MVAPTNKWDLGNVIRNTLNAAGEKRVLIADMGDMHIVRRGDHTINIREEDRYVSFTVHYRNREAALRVMGDLMLNIPSRYHDNVIAFTVDHSKQAVKEGLGTFLELSRYR